jgi:hypothetical protein
VTRQAPALLPSRSTLLIAALWPLSIGSAVEGAYVIPLPHHPGGGVLAFILLEILHVLGLVHR